HGPGGLPIRIRHGVRRSRLRLRPGFQWRWGGQQHRPGGVSDAVRDGAAISYADTGVAPRLLRPNRVAPGRTPDSASGFSPLSRTPQKSALYLREFGYSSGATPPVRARPLNVRSRGLPQRSEDMA